ncbi:hypothetical protein RHEC894_CH01612 [Rhizobium sp. CIAT894]|nr:hypothetical protein RHEC894_CH01612 [Rhizobium sp. CIAT894]
MDAGPPTWTGKSLRSRGLLQFYLLHPLHPKQEFKKNTILDGFPITFGTVPRFSTPRPDIA